MRIRAIAAPSAHSNAVGSLELECTPEGLLLVHLGLGAYSQGYATGAVTSGTHVVVPWNDVEEVRDSAKHVLLTLAPRTTPLNKLCLTHFSDGTRPPEAEVTRRRRILWIAVASLTVTVALAVGGQWRHWSADASVIGSFAIGSVAALVVLGLGLVAERILLGNGPESDLIHRRFISEIAHFRPKPVLISNTAATGPEPEPIEWRDLIRVLPRSTLAIVITLTATTLAAVLTSSWLVDDPEAKAPRPAAPAPSPPPAPVVPAAAPAPQPTPSEEAPTAPPTAEPPAPDRVAKGQPCQCERADSSLWALQFPRLSTLLIEQKSRSHKDHHHLEIELAVVNNGAKTLDEVNLSVQFYEDDGKKPTKHRPLHYGAKLRPGQAIKWHVEARGTSFRVENPIVELLGEEREALASADDFADLLAANHRPVRLHGAMMLAFLGDPRAKKGALDLREALRESEVPYLDRLLSTQGDLITCDWRASQEGRVRQVSACVYNVSTKRLTKVATKVRALDRLFDYRNPVSAPPVVIVERTFQLNEPLEPREGRVTLVELDTDNLDGRIPQAFEVVADLEHLL